MGRFSPLDQRWKLAIPEGDAPDPPAARNRNRPNDGSWDTAVIPANAAERRLMHARATMRKGRLKHVLKTAQDIIGVQHCVFGDLTQAIGTMRHDVGQSAREHAHLAMEGNHAAEAVRMPRAGCVFFDQRIAPVCVALGK
eukprot:gene64146-87740_t